MATHRILLRDVINRALKCCGDYFGTGYIAGQTWTRAQVILAINHALLDWADRTGFLRKIDVVALADGTKTYSLPDDCLRPIRIGFYDDNACTWVSRPTTITLQDISFRPITGDASPQEHFTEFLEYSKFGYQPTVGEDINAYVSYVREPTYWDDEATYPEDGIPTWFHKDIKWGAALVLLTELKADARKAKITYIKGRWDKVINRMKTIKDYHGHDHGMVPL